MKKIDLGDVFEIETKKGKAYFQYVFDHESLGEYIKVFYELHSISPVKFNEIVNNEDYFYIGFALKEAARQKIVKKVASLSMSEKYKFPTHFRTEHLFNDELWQIVDVNTWERESVKVLNEEQKKLSPWGVWNDTLLIENLEKGWRLENWI